MNAMNVKNQAATSVCGARIVAEFLVERMPNCVLKLVIGGTPVNAVSLRNNKSDLLGSGASHAGGTVYAEVFGIQTPAPSLDNPIGTASAITSGRLSEDDLAEDLCRRV